MTLALDGQVEHRPYVEQQALRFSRLEVPLCEFDDLVQVGMLKVFLLHKEGKPITHTAILNAMRDELRGKARAGRLGLSGFPKDPNGWETPDVLYLDEIDGEEYAVDPF